MLLYWCEKLTLLNWHKRRDSDDEILEIRCKVLSDHKTNAGIKNEILCI